MEDLSKQWTNFSLLDREGDKITLGKNKESNDHIIAAKFLTRRVLNVDAIARTFKPLWRAINGFTIKNMGNHVMLFIFEKQEDVHRVMVSEPWTFDKHLVVIQKYEKNTPLQEVSFNKTSLWVQVFDIPVRYMSKETAEDICSSMGEVGLSEFHPSEEGGRFVRVRVRVDITKPLCRGRVVDLEEGGRVWVSFKYERLPIICYWCGRLDHDERNCSLWIDSRGSLKPQDKQFGSFMRASQSENTRNSVVHVSGFFDDRKDNQAFGEKQKASSDVQPVVTPTPDNSDPPPSGDLADMGTSVLAKQVINAAVAQAASSLHIDVDLTTVPQGKEDSSPPFADRHQPVESDVSLSAVGTSKGVVELCPKTLNTVLPHKSSSTDEKGDPFLAKLHEIDREIQIFDQISCEKKGSADTHPRSQLSRPEGCQNRETDGMESSSIEYVGAHKGFINHPDGLDRKDKVEVGPGPVKEVKIGHWTRLTTRPRVDRMEVASVEEVGPKRKVSDRWVRENSNAEKEKKQKTEGETLKQNESPSTQLGSAEVAEQPRREL